MQRNKNSPIYCAKELEEQNMTECLSLCLYKNWSETIAPTHSYYKPVLPANNSPFSYSHERRTFQKKKFS